MLYSLRFGLLLAMLAVAAVAIFTITIFAGYTTRIEFSRYVNFVGTVREEQMQEAVLTFFTTGGGAVTAKPSRPLVMPAEDVFPTSGTEMILVNPAQMRVYPLEKFKDLNITNINEVRFFTAADGTVQVYEGEKNIGTLTINPADELAFVPAQIEFVQSVSWGLLLAAGMAGISAIFLTLILSRRILLPVQALTEAARRLEDGDLSQRVTAPTQGEIGKLAHAFNSMAETLGRNEELRRNMVGDIAHELRTPLTNIRGYLEALQDGVVAPDKFTIDLIYDEAILLNRLIQDLQELALAEAGQLRYDRQAVPVNDVVEQTVTMFQPGASSKNIALVMELQPHLPMVYADKKRLAQIMRNLINNAVTHTEEGCIRVSAVAHDKEIEISVQDTGEGIDEEHIPYIFERFYRVDPSRSRATGGAGLGLAIVKQLVEAQGGWIKVESKIGMGSSFTFALPVYGSR
jgi:signal transduction histidine kinase